jgi:hypothetical protein
MTRENTIDEAEARLRAAGLPETSARALAERVAGGLEALRRQVEALPPTAEPATTFTASEK